MKNDDVFEYHEDTDEKIQMTQNAAKRRDMYQEESSESDSSSSDLEEEEDNYVKEQNETSGLIKDENDFTKIN